MTAHLEFVEERASGDVVYDHMPGKRTADRGTVLVNRRTREPEKVKGPKDGDWWPDYFSHVWRKALEMIDAGDLRQETYAAWY